MSTGIHTPSTSDLARLLDKTGMYDAVIDEIDGRRIRIGGQWLTDYASCNYLGFDLDPEIIDRIGVELRRWGTHPSWSRLLGNPRLYPQIEERLTDLLAAPDTLVLPTITHIHFSVLPALADGGDVFVEAHAHKTIFDGAIHARAAGATLHRFHADDPDELTTMLRRAPAGQARLVCLDGVNSMTGNLPDLPKLAAICREHGALLYVDDAHGFGVVGERSPDEPNPYGRRGNAVVRHLGESYEGIILVGGFSKAYSSLLAFLTVPSAVKRHLKVTVPPYLYSGPSPIASLASVLAGFDVNEKRGDALRTHLYELSAKVLGHVRSLGVATPNTGMTPVVELLVAPDRDLVEVAELLWARGVYVTLAEYPLVPRNQVGFRIQLTAAHTHEQVDELCGVLTDLADRGVLRCA